MTQLEQVLRAVLDGHRTSATVAAALNADPQQMASCLSTLAKRGAIRVTGKIRRSPDSQNYSNTWGPGPRVAEALIAFTQAREPSTWVQAKPDPATESPAAIEARYQAAMRVIRARRTSGVDADTPLVRSSLLADGVYFWR